MGRPATGCAQWRDGKWLAILSVGAKRVPVEMPGLEPHPEGCACTVKAPCEVRAGATRQAAIVAKRARDRGALLPGDEGGETCGAYFIRWIAARKREGIVTTRDDEGRWRKWLEARLASRAIRGVTTRDLELLVQAIDKDVRAGKLAWRTSLHVWGLVTKMFDDACRSKDVGMRVRSDNPATNVRGPDRGPDKASAFLFPSEVTRLAACALVLQYRRRLYVFASYTGLRAGEIEGSPGPTSTKSKGSSSCTARATTSPMSSAARRLGAPAGCPSNRTCSRSSPRCERSQAATARCSPGFRTTASGHGFCART